MSAKKETHAWFSPGLLQPLDWLLLAVPAAFAIRYVPAWENDTLLFIITGIAIIPLAGWMGRATEHLGARAGHGVGGLLNATFGNAAELIIALMALSKGLTGVVKASIAGSMPGARRLHSGRRDALSPPDVQPDSRAHFRHVAQPGRRRWRGNFEERCQRQRFP